MVSTSSDDTNVPVGAARFPTCRSRVELETNLADVHERIATAARQVDRDPGDIRLIPVTKTMGEEPISWLADTGVNLAFVRFDNVPEFVAHAVADWCARNDVDAVFIGPGSLWQNAWIESFNGKLRDELLNGWQFESLFEAQVIIGAWRTDYDENRPHSALGGLTPNEYAENRTETHQPQPA